MGAILLIVAIALLILASVLCLVGAAESGRSHGAVRRQTGSVPASFDDLARAKASLLANT